MSTVVEDPPVPGVDHDEPACAEVPAEAEPHSLRSVDLGIGAVGELDQQRPDVALGVEDAVVVGVGGQLLGGEVPQVLVDPVGRQRRADPLAPPRLLGHLLAPGLRGVPVVVDVVVVEDHCGGDAGHEPADLGVGPGVAVETDVFVVADDLVVGPVRVALAPPGDAPAVLRGELVGVDLVAEQQQRVRPLLWRAPRHARRVGVERVDAELAGLFGDDDLRVAAGPEDDPVSAGGGRTAGVDDTVGIGRHRRWPDALTVDQHLVGVAGVRCEPGDRHDGEWCPHTSNVRAWQPSTETVAARSSCTHTEAVVSPTCLSTGPRTRGIVQP